MAGELPKTAEDLKEMTKAFDSWKASMSGSSTVFADFGEGLAKVFIGEKEYARAVEESNKGNKALLDDLKSTINVGREVGQAFYSAADGTRTYSEQFNQLARATGDSSGLLGTPIKLIKAYDDATTITRKFKDAAIDVGSAFGQSFGQIQPQVSDYRNAILLAGEKTYETRDQIEKQSKALATMGISMEEMSKTTYVAGTAQNMLSEGFLLGSETGLGSQKVFEMMAASTRKMGLSFEDSGRPLLALQAMSKNTGLPISDLAKDVFGLAEKYARFGTTVESLSPVVKRFTDVLGTGFKGLAIESVQQLIQGLGAQVNTTQGAFMAMQSGMARPGSGVAGAMLDFESAMAEPAQAMKMLSSSLSNIGGGKILKFEEAKAGGESTAAQFKLQRDMLTQLTGINDPQQTRTLLSILADVQSGREVTQDQKETLSSAMQSGNAKQDERATAADRVMRTIAGLLVDIDMGIANFAEKNLPSPQAQAAGLQSGGKGIEDFVSAIAKRGAEIGDKIIPASIKDLASKGSGMWNAQLNKMEPGPELRGRAEAKDYGQAYRPTPQFMAITSPNTTTPDATSNQATAAPGSTPGQNITFTFRGEGPLLKAIAEAVSRQINQSNRGQ